jgi:hypothetical protein
VATIDATPANVAALLRARTKDAGGNELGQWTTETRPTLAQVTEALTLATGIVEARVGTPVDACLSAFHVAVCFEAACMIEKSYFPEQVESGRSHYDQLRAEADALLDGVRECQAGNLPDAAGGERTRRVYDVYTPPGPGGADEASPGVAAAWQSNLEHPMP